MSERFRVIVCGGRNYATPQMDGRAGLDHETALAELRKVCDTLDSLKRKHPNMHIVTGGATGADAAALAWAMRNEVSFEGYPANWSKWGDAAGPQRNTYMVALGADAVVAFPGGSGTAHMIRIAEKAGIKVWCPFGQPERTDG